MEFTLQNHKSISFLIEFYLKNTKDFENENLNNLIITNASIGSKLEKQKSTNLIRLVFDNINVTNK